MSKQILIVCLLLTAIIYYTNCCAADESTKSEIMNGMSPDNETNLDQEAIMAMCNETFRTPMGMLFISSDFSEIIPSNHSYVSH